MAQKYVDEETKDEARRDLLNYDKNLLVTNYRRLEPKNMVDLVPDQESKNHIVKYLALFK